jgi:hypothetical protein
MEFPPGSTALRTIAKFAALVAPAWAMVLVWV